MFRRRPEGSGLGGGGKRSISGTTPSFYDARGGYQKGLSKGLLEPTYKEHLLGRASGDPGFQYSQSGDRCRESDHRWESGPGIPGQVCLRDNVLSMMVRIASLRRFKDDMKDCSQGLECGIWIENYSDVKLGECH